MKLNRWEAEDKARKILSSTRVVVRIRRKDVVDRFEILTWGKRHSPGPEQITMPTGHEVDRVVRVVAAAGTSWEEAIDRLRQLVAVSKVTP